MKCKHAEDSLCANRLPMLLSRRPLVWPLCIFIDNPAHYIFSIEALGITAKCTMILPQEPFKTWENNIKASLNDSHFNQSKKKSTIKVNSTGNTVHIKDILNLI